MAYRPSQKFKKTLLGGGAVVVLAGLNAPAALSFAEEKYHAYKIAQPAYKARYGSWAPVQVPGEYRLNAIHAALLHTGKVLLIAGSGNNQKNFDAGSFKTVLWDPADNTFTAVDTPEDFFCAGHSQLPDGRLLVAGGTARLRGPRRRGQPRGRRHARQEREPRQGRHPQEGHRLPVAVGRRVRVPVRRHRPQGQARVHHLVLQERPDETVGDQGDRRRGPRLRRGEAGGPEGPHHPGRPVPDRRPEGRGRPERLRAGPEAHHGEAGLPGHQVRVRVRPRGREVRPGRPHGRRALVPDARHAPGRPRPRRLRPQRRRRHRARRQRDLRPRDQEVDQGPLPLLPHLSGALPHPGRQALLHRRQRRLRPRRQGPHPRAVGPEEERLHRDPRHRRPRPAGDRRLPRPPAGPGPEVHGPRRRRRR